MTAKDAFEGSNTDVSKASAAEEHAGGDGKEKARSCLDMTQSSRKVGHWADQMSYRSVQITLEK